MNCDQGGELHRRGDDVIARLALVDVVIGMDRLPRAQRLAELLIRAVRDHLVGIGIGRRSRTGLEDVDHEVLVELSFLHLFGCVLNRVGEAGLEQPQLGIDQRGLSSHQHRLLARSDRQRDVLVETILDVQNQTLAPCLLESAGAHG